MLSTIFFRLLYIGLCCLWLKRDERLSLGTVYLLLLAFVVVVVVLEYRLNDETTTPDPRHSQAEVTYSTWLGKNVTIKDMIAHFYDILAQTTERPASVFGTDCGSQQACIQNCSRPLVDDPKERLMDILNSPNLTLSDQQRDLILTMGQAIPESDVIFLSASSSNHYNEMQAMFHNLHTVVLPLLPNITIVLFDIGLSEQERKMTEKHCRCHVIRFPAEKFPPHLKDNVCYSWKPLIVRAAMEKTRHMLVYQDASIRWSKQIPTVLDRAERIGIQYVRSDGLSRISLHTMRETFDYFGELPCAFAPFPELEGNNAMYRRDPFIVRAMLEPWARCALEASCMCPVSPQKVLDCRKPIADHRCHRFDQSAIGMISAKLFNKDIHRILAPDYKFIDIHRGHTMANYFKSL
ncbi:unnamed protein product [Lymnaea stagnalis]|uniref:Uncharacterized protein n=1 Tax=Lymnaea stagnalis TaxID=6523 RepID=A0AAV2I8F6_LYMST